MEIAIYKIIYLRKPIACTIASACSQLNVQFVEDVERNPDLPLT